MHTVGLHSALAIKRQRKHREELKRARERRYSSQSTESGIGGGASSCGSPGSAVGSSDPLEDRKKRSVPLNLLETNVVPPIGMLHVGIVFIVLGMFLIGSGLIPDDYTVWRQSLNWWNQLVFSGLCALAIGVFLIGLNHYLSQREDEELTSYVERQLNRSRSGKRLIKDEETGCMKTKREKRNDEQKQALNLPLEENFDEQQQQQHQQQWMPGGSVLSPTSAVRSPPPSIVISPKTDLEKILEEDASERGDEECAAAAPLTVAAFNKDTMVNGSVSVHHNHHKQHHHQQPSSQPHCYQPETDRELVVTRYYHTHQEY